MRRRDIRVFSKDWFKINQKWLLLALNFPIPQVREYLRFKLNLTAVEPDIPIVRYDIDSYTARLDKEHYQLIAYSRNPLAKDLAREFQAIWEMLHRFDMCIANKFLPAVNLGYDTLTAYPDASPETTTMDGRFGTNCSTYSKSWSDRRTYYSSCFEGWTTSGYNTQPYYIFNSSNQYKGFIYWFSLFDTSSLGSCIISSANFKYTNSNFCKLYYASWSSSGANIALTSFNPSSNTSITGTDMSTIGNTDYGNINGRTTTNNQRWTISLNSSGIEAIAKNGITKFIGTFLGDINNNPPSATSSASFVSYNTYMVETTTSSYRPLLEVTYTPALSTMGMII